MFEIIDRQTQNLAHLLDDLLDVSRISRDKVTLRKEYIDLAAVLNRAVDTARPLMEQKHHELIVEMAQEQMPVYVDARLAGQDDIGFNAGSHTDVVRMPYPEFEQLVCPQLLYLDHLM